MKDRRNPEDAPPPPPADRSRAKAPPQLDWGAGGETPPSPELAPVPEAGAGDEGSASTEAPVAPADAPPPTEGAPADAAAVEAPASAEAVVEAGAEPAEGEAGKAARDGLPPEPEPHEPPGTEGGVQVGAVAPEGHPAPEEPPAEPASPEPAAAVEEPFVNVLEVRGMDWRAVRAAVAGAVAGERAERIISRMEERLAGGGPLGLAFEEYAAGPDDRAIQVGERWPLGEVWFVGDVHGDLLALEAALQHIDRSGGGADARIVFLGDLFDDGVHAAEVVLRVLELVLDGPMRVTVVTGNHDEALAYADGRFTSTVLPSDFTDWLNANPDHPWAARLGRLIIRFFQRAPRALFFPDGLLVAHGGVPHTDLHADLQRGGNWNDPRVLQDFVWLRAHPRARKRIPNRTTRGSEFGREDFAAFCAVATKLGRPVGRMIRGHDHVEERYAVYPAWARHPVLTINTLSHRLPREVFGEYERVPVVARWVRGELPEVRRLFVPAELIREVYPEPGGEVAAEVAG